MAREVLRSGATILLTLGVEVGAGIWLLFLFALAVAWTSIDQRLTHGERRRRD
jgi:hypothetical protein